MNRTEHEPDHTDSQLRFLRGCALTIVVTVAALTAIVLAFLKLSGILD